MAEVVIVPDAATAGGLVADEILRLIRRKPDTVLGFATGSTPLPVYQALAARRDGVDFSQVRGFALDEYVGLPEGHPESYATVIVREVVEPLGLRPGQVMVPDGRVVSTEHAGADFEAAIHQAGGIDLQLLGIGTEGHLAFNEPGSSFASLTRVKMLAQRTREDNARFFGSIDQVPTHCITQGLGTIQRARHLVLLAFGEGKANAIARALEGPVTASVPGSVVQLHPHVSVVVDEAAASQLELTEYYRTAFAGKPAWQGL